MCWTSSNDSWPMTASKWNIWIYADAPKKRFAGCFNHQGGVTRCSWKTKECIIFWSSSHLTLSYDKQACHRSKRFMRVFNQDHAKQHTLPKFNMGFTKKWHPKKQRWTELGKASFLGEQFLKTWGSVIITSPEALPVLAQHLAANCNAWRISGMRMVMFWTVAKEHVQNCPWPSVPGAIPERWSPSLVISWGP